MSDEAARQAQVALVLAKYGKQQQAQTQPAPTQQKAAGVKPAVKPGNGLADGRKRLEQAIWGKNPAPSPSQGGWANENIADTINRSMGGGDVAKSIDNVVAKFRRGRSAPKPQPAKGKGIEPSS